MQGDSDTTLIERCLKGETRAFGLLIDRYQTPIYNAAYRMLKNKQDAEDVAQDVFVKAFENLSSYNPKYKFFSWIYRMAVNESINLLKKRNRLNSIDPRMKAPGKQPDERAVRQEVAERLDDALMELRPEDRALVLLKHYQGFSYRDIGYILETPAKTVKSRLYTARQRLRDIMLNQGYIPNA